MQLKMFYGYPFSNHCTPKIAYIHAKQIEPETYLWFLFFFTWYYYMTYLLIVEDIKPDPLATLKIENIEDYLQESWYKYFVRQRNDFVIDVVGSSNKFVETANVNYVIKIYIFDSKYV